MLTRSRLTQLETYKPIALAKFKIPSFVRTTGELNADIMTLLKGCQS